jgi:hypothetical protein
MAMFLLLLRLREMKTDIFPYAKDMPSAFLKYIDILQQNRCFSQEAQTTTLVVEPTLPSPRIPAMTGAGNDYNLGCDDNQGCDAIGRGGGF